MCALLIVMIIFIVVSGIIVFGVIITVKYYNEEDVDKIGPALKRVAILQDPHALQIQRVARKQVDSREQTTQLVQLP
jgi:hypothetical protein